MSDSLSDNPAIKKFDSLLLLPYPAEEKDSFMCYKYNMNPIIILEGDNFTFRCPIWILVSEYLLMVFYQKKMIWIGFVF